MWKVVDKLVYSADLSSVNDYFTFKICSFKMFPLFTFHLKLFVNTTLSLLTVISYYNYSDTLEIFSGRRLKEFFETQIAFN